jgi:YVTN family beta-propeller protein
MTVMALWAAFAILLPGGSRAATGPGHAEKPEAEKAETTQSRRIEREGMIIEYSARAAGAGKELLEGGFAEVSFRITDAATGAPLRSLYPGAFLDLARSPLGKESEVMTCREKVGLFLQGRVGIRPLIDLNGYFVLALNRDSTISVIDPLVGMTGRTYLFANIPLKKPGADWVKSRDEKRLFVTMPLASQVAVVDTDALKAVGNVDVGGRPVRIALQPDGRYLWVGNDAKGAKESGVVVIDTATRAVAARIPTGAGHHEIAFSKDDRYAFVSNGEDGTVSVIDVGKLEKVRDVKTGSRPVSLAYSILSEALYVVDGEDGEVAVVDGKRHEVSARIQAGAGLGTIRFTEDGRFGFVASPGGNAVHVVDSSTNRLAHTIPLEGRPFQIAFTRSMAYVRSLDSERVGMIHLSEVGGSRTPPVTGFAAGEVPLGKVGPGTAVAGTMTTALDEAALLVANPSDGNVYFYMEGMVAPMATFRNYGHRPAALEVANRSLKEGEPGVYSGTVRFPVAGTYDVAFLLDTPRLVHCFSEEVKVNPALAYTGPAVSVEYLTRERRVKAGEGVAVRFRLTDPRTGEPRTGIRDVGALYYLATGRTRRHAMAKEAGEGIYEVALPALKGGAYYVYVVVPSLKVGHLDLPYFTLIAEDEGNPPPPPKMGIGGTGEESGSDPPKEKP